MFVKLFGFAALTSLLAGGAFLGPWNASKNAEGTGCGRCTQPESDSAAKTCCKQEATSTKGADCCCGTDACRCEACNCPECCADGCDCPICACCGGADAKQSASVPVASSKAPRTAKVSSPDCCCGTDACQCEACNCPECCADGCDCPICACCDGADAEQEPQGKELAADAK